MVSKYFDELTKRLGTITALDSPSFPQVAFGAMNDALLPPVDTVDSQLKVSGIINRVISAGAGCAMTCTTSEVAARVAEHRTGVDITKVMQLPHIFDLKDKAVIQRGHKVRFGRSILRTTWLTKARVTEMEDVPWASTYQLARASNGSTTFAFHVVSRHPVQHRLTALKAFYEAAHAHDIPVIVDVPLESDMYGFAERSIDSVCISGYKLLTEPSFGICTERIYVEEGSIYYSRGIICAIASMGLKSDSKEEHCHYEK